MGFLFVLILTVVVIWLVKAGFGQSKGQPPERRVSAWLHGLDSEIYTILDDVIIPDTREGVGTTQIDHVVLSPYGIFVVETKNYAGWIFGGIKTYHWCQVLFQEKHQFQNPYRQNFKHMACLAELTRLPRNLFIPVVAFAGGCEIKTRRDLPNSLVTSKKELLNYISQFKDTRIQEGTLEYLKGLLTKAISDDNSAMKDAHVAHVHAVVAQKALMVELAGGKPPKCPHCGSAMVLRKAKRGPKAGHEFWGCIRYPRCHGIIEGEER